MGRDLLLTPEAIAKQGAPHTFSASANFSTVNLSWAASDTKKELKWHNGRDYDGDAGVQTTTQKPSTIYVAANYNPSDLALVEGEKIVSLNYFEYRPTLRVTAIIWENGVIVREQDADLKQPAFVANQWRTIAFSEPYEIKKGKTIRFGFRIEHGSNLDFVAIMDNAVNSNGDLRSYDGKSWVHNGRGTYLITANLLNETDETPDGYNVYADGKKINDNILTNTSLELASQADGKHAYKVEAVYGQSSFATPEIQLDVKSPAGWYPGVPAVQAATSSMNGTFSWKEPLKRDNSNTLTWTDSQFNLSIGGTASSNTKVWIKNEFDPNDLLAFVGSKITAINAHFAEKVVQSMIVYVMKDGVITHHDTVPAEKIAEIDAAKWVKFPLSTPVEIEAGHTYAYGYYMMHTPKMHPVSADKTIAMGSKANSFSTSSPNSKAFESTKPSWKTLASGAIDGGWMMTADVEGTSNSYAALKGFNIYRDGEKVAENVANTTWEDEVPAPGTYTYGFEAVGTDGKTSAIATLKANYKLPDSYRAPLIETSKLDKEEGTITFNWDMDVELKHYATPTYKVGFDEDLNLSYGSRFTAQELADYEGYSIKRINFALGETLPNTFSIQIVNGAGTVLRSHDIAPGDVNAMAIYSLELDEPLTITGKEDLYLVYSGKVPAKVNAILLDGGPLQEGGAMINMGGGWLKLGSLNPNYNGYNIVIGAVVSENGNANASERILATNSTIENSLITLPVASASEAALGFGIESSTPVIVKAPLRSPLKPASYNVYRNGEKVQSTTGRSYTEVIPSYDTHSYTVTAVYPNGWESADSDPLLVENPINQAGPAPYELQGNARNLTWKAPEAAPVLTYAVDGLSYGVGMTGSGTRETYAVNKFPADSLVKNVGNRINHIRFALFSTDLYSASVVIFKNLNIAYEQPLNVEDLVTVQEGYNTIRLNEPFEIEANDEIMIGYHITYANGTKPMIFDEGPATDGLGNLMSASAGHTSWKTLKSLNSSLDGNWRIYAILEAPEQMAKVASRAEGANRSYNLYRDGQLFKSGIATEAYSQEIDLPVGRYTVTALEDEKESAPSNVLFIASSGVDTIGSENNGISYNAQTGIITVPEGMSGIVYDAAGRKLMSGTGSISVATLSAGVYVYVSSEGTVIRFVR